MFIHKKRNVDIPTADPGVCLLKDDEMYIRMADCRTRMLNLTPEPEGFEKLECEVCMFVYGKSTNKIVLVVKLTSDLHGAQHELCFTSMGDILKYK